MMAKILTEEMNILPRLSYRWLKVNHFGFEVQVQFPIKPYTLQYLNTDMDPKLDLIQADLGLFPALNANSSSFGVSREVFDLIATHTNAGFELRVPAGRTIDQPVQICYQFEGANNVVIDRNVIVAEANSSLTVIVDYASDQKTKAYHAGLTQIVAHKDATVTLVKVQRLGDDSIHLDAHQVDVGPSATVRYIQVELGGRYSITNYQGTVKGQGEALIDSIYLGDGERVLDLSYHMIHEGYRSKSDIQVRGALKDRSKKVFRGTLDFRKGAYLADGNEEEYVYLLDPKVKSDAIPLLLSEEDNVQGGHAASAGKVDPDQIFYLMTRGLNEAEATEAVVKGSFSYVLDQLPQDLKDTVQGELQRRLVHDHV